uniref:Kinesin-like protein n=1 Tax=Timema californicum TaxID=61474 RepID=A0A7R9IWA5_TIMCA|nr:unnamed protein product [Timema californicum]
MEPALVRIRPLSEKEIRSRFKNIIRIDHPNHISILNLTHNGDERPKTFAFDAVLGEASSQEDVYECFGRPVVEKVLEGYNGTIFAYGQTGSGKTYTMEGVQENKDEWGIVPNAIHHIFLAIDQATDRDVSISFSVRVSYVEVYNDNIHDLLSEDHTASLSIREDPLHGVFVKRLTGFVVASSSDLYNVTTLGNRNRATGSTKMNEKSSRSHAVLMVTIQQNVSGKLMTRVGSLHLVDLAGSERQSKTGTSGVRLKEASKINQSLSTLGKVIAALVDAKSTHVPYRESKLTLLLKNSLGGNSVTTMVANVAPSDYNYDETLCTLRYADRAKHIKNHVQVRVYSCIACNFYSHKCSPVVRDMTRHLDLYDHILSQWIPEDKLLLIEKNMTWDEWTDEWTISHSSLCGNNVQRQQEPSRSLKQDQRGHSDIYRSYSLESSQRKSATIEEKLKLPLIDKKPSTSTSLEE